MGVALADNIKYDIEVDVGKLTVNSVGDYTVKKIMDILDSERAVEENKSVLLNFKGLTVLGASHKDNIGMLLKLIIEYNCSVVGLSELVEDELRCYLHSDKLIVETEGSTEFLKVFKENLNKGNKNRLRVKDNFYSKDFIKKELIIDLGFKGNNYYYIQLKPCYTEPKYIVEEDFNELFSLKIIHKSDLILNEYRIRESVGDTEYLTVDLLSKLLKSKGIDEYVREVKYYQGLD